MKIEMAVVKSEFRETRALTPAMMGRPFTVPNEEWARHLILASRGAIQKVPMGTAAVPASTTQNTPALSPAEKGGTVLIPRKRGRPRKSPAPE